MEALLEEVAEPLISKAMSMAVAGDTAALRLRLKCILPADGIGWPTWNYRRCGMPRRSPEPRRRFSGPSGMGKITPGEGETMAKKRLLPSPLTARNRELLARIEAGIHTNHAGQLIIDILNEGRQRARLRSLQDEELRQSNPPATGGA
jgi:hypothetical protein